MSWTSFILVWLSGFICGFGLFLILVFQPEITKAKKISATRIKDYVLDKKLDLKLWMQKRNR
jgi:hypothetical protein